MSMPKTSLLGDHIWHEELPWDVHTASHAPGQDGVCPECVHPFTVLAVVQAQAVSGAADLIHGAINTSSIDALSRHQGVQELHMMPGGGKH